MYKKQISIFMLINSVYCVKNYYNLSQREIPQGKEFGFIFRDSRNWMINSVDANNQGFCNIEKFFTDFDSNKEHIAKSFKELMMCFNLSIENKIDIINRLISAKNEMIPDENLYQYEIPMTIIMIILDGYCDISKFPNLATILDENHMRIVQIMISDSEIEKTDNVDYALNLLLTGYKIFRSVGGFQPLLTQIILKCFITKSIPDEIYKRFFSNRDIDISGIINNLINQLYTLEKDDPKVMQIIKFIINDDLEQRNDELTLNKLQYIKSLIEDNKDEDARRLTSRITARIINIKKMMQLHKHEDKTGVFVRMIEAILSNHSGVPKTLQEKKQIHDSIEFSILYINRRFNCLNEGYCSTQDVKCMMTEIQKGEILKDGRRLSLSEIMKRIIECDQIHLDEKIATINALINNNENYFHHITTIIIACILIIEKKYKVTREVFDMSKLNKVLTDLNYTDIISYFRDEKPILGKNMMFVIKEYNLIMGYREDLGGRAILSYMKYFGGQAILEYLLQVDIISIKRDGNHTIHDFDRSEISSALSLKLLEIDEISDQLLSIIKLTLNRTSLNDLLLIKQSLETKRPDAEELIAKIDEQIKHNIEILRRIIAPQTLIPTTNRFRWRC